MAASAPLAASFFEQPSADRADPFSSRCNFLFTGLANIGVVEFDRNMGIRSRSEDAAVRCGWQAWC